METYALNALRDDLVGTGCRGVLVDHVNAVGHPPLLSRMLHFVVDRLHHSVPSLQGNVSDVNFDFCLPWDRVDVVGQHMPGACCSYCVLSSCSP